MRPQTRRPVDLGSITRWDDDLVVGLAAGLGIDPTTVASVWLLEDGEDEPERIDTMKALNILTDPEVDVLLLGISAAVPAAAVAVSTADTPPVWYGLHG